MHHAARARGNQFQHMAVGIDSLAHKIVAQVHGHHQNVVHHLIRLFEDKLIDVLQRVVNDFAFFGILQVVGIVDVPAREFFYRAVLPLKPEFRENMLDGIVDHRCLLKPFWHYTTAARGAQASRAKGRWPNIRGRASLYAAERHTPKFHAAFAFKIENMCYNTEQNICSIRVERRSFACQIPPCSWISCAF